MSVERVRRLCLSFPHATENVQWGADLVFKIAGKMFAVTCLEPSAHVLSFKCADEEFVALIEQPGIVPAPYLARNRWVALETFEALPTRHLDGLLRNSYEMVVAKLPKKTRAALDGTGGATGAAAKAAKTKPSAVKPVKKKAAGKAQPKSAKAKRGR